MWWTGWPSWCGITRWTGSTLTTTSTPPPTRPSMRPSLRPAAPPIWPSGGGENVTALVKAAHDAVKAQDPTLRFGVSPQGNPDNDLNQQYSDVYGWLAASGEEAVVDYLCPPALLGGMAIPCPAGSTRFAYENILSEWMGIPRGSAVLYIGLGAWRIGGRRRRRGSKQHLPVVHRAGAGGSGGGPAGPGGRGLRTVPVWVPSLGIRPGPSWPGPNAPP